MLLGDRVMPKRKIKRGRLAPGHGWRAQPNHTILVLDRGALRLEYPAAWVVKVTDDCLRIYDKEPPADDCALGVSSHRWPSAVLGVSVASLVGAALASGKRTFIAVEPIVEEANLDHALAWGEGRWIAAPENREACARLCIARNAEVHALLTFDFWLSDRERVDPVWRGILATLQLGQWVDDPLRGPSLS